VVGLGQGEAPLVKETPLRTRLAALALSLLSAGFYAGDAPAQPVAADAFGPCADAKEKPALAGSLCARVSAPLDERTPSAGRVTLFVRKFPAQGRRLGQLWLVAGGPGESGATFYPLLERLRSAAPGYDLMVPDHRGTGYSTRLCPTEESPESAGETALEGAEWGTCFASLQAESARARAFSISNAARDLRSLIDRYRAGGHVYLYGVSYGTQLVLRTMQAAPPRKVDGIVLDSLVPRETTQQWDLSRRAMVVDQVGRAVLADCDRRSDCRSMVGGSAEAALAAIEADKKAETELGSPPKVFFGALLDDPVQRAAIPAIIAGLRSGDLKPLQDAKARFDVMGAKFNDYPQSPSSIPLVTMISVSENDARPNLTHDQLQDEARGQLFTSPLPGFLIDPGVPSYAKDASFGQEPRVLPPTLVMQGDLDPKTPYAGAVEHVAALRTSGPISMMRVSGAPHFLVFTAPDCSIQAIRRFLAHQRTPEVCSVRAAPRAVTARSTTAARSAWRS
jgi:pimeloyl-ACP methyl ester carboxylesterase